jgi:hypothetical protein
MFVKRCSSSQHTVVYNSYFERLTKYERSIVMFRKSIPICVRRLGMLPVEVEVTTEEPQHSSFEHRLLHYLCKIESLFNGRLEPRSSQRTYNAPLVSNNFSSCHSTGAQEPSSLSLTVRSIPPILEQELL